MPVGGLLERVRQRQHPAVGVPRPDDLQPHRQPVHQPARHARGGLLRHVERVGERRPRRPPLPRPPRRHLDARLERRDRQRGGDEQVVALVELAHPHAQLAAHRHRLQVARRRRSARPQRPRPPARGPSGLHVRGQRGQRRRGAREPQRLERGDRVGEPRVDLLDAHPQRRRARRRPPRTPPPPPGRRRRTRASALTATRRPATGASSAATVGAAGASAQASRGVGAGHDVEQQRGVGRRARHRPDVRQRPERARRVDRHPTPRRLDRGDAGEGRRDAHRAAAVGAERERRHAQRDGRRAAARRAAGRARGVPRVAGDPGAAARR